MRELKAQLSAFVKRAAAGELITVTDRGRPVATLGPVLDAVDLSEGVAQGWVTPATRRGLKPVARQRATGTTRQALAEDRTE